MYKVTLKQTLASMVLAVGFIASTQVTATTYQYEINNPPGSDSAGDISTFAATYNDANQQLSFSSTIQQAGSHLANAFWLVLSDGPNPKHHYNEYAIFYGDAATGNLTTYVYNGVNSANSWNTPGEFIESFAGGLTVDTSVSNEVTFSFSIDVSAINAYTPTTPGINDWDGALFASKIGIWYHPAVLADTGATYNADGSLAAFPVARGGWYDTADRVTNVVPVPTAAWLFASGLIGLVGISRRSN